MTRRRPPTRHLPAALLVAGWVATGCRPVPEPIETREESSLNERSRAEIRRARPRPEPIRIATASDDAVDPVAEPPSSKISDPKLDRFARADGDTDHEPTAATDADATSNPAGDVAANRFPSPNPSIDRSVGLSPDPRGGRQSSQRTMSSLDGTSRADQGASKGQGQSQAEDASKGQGQSQGEDASKGQGESQDAPDSQCDGGPKCDGGLQCGGGSRCRGGSQGAGESQSGGQIGVGRSSNGSTLATTTRDPTETIRSAGEARSEDGGDDSTSTVAETVLERPREMAGEAARLGGDGRIDSSTPRSRSDGSPGGLAEGLVETDVPKTGSSARDRQAASTDLRPTPEDPLRRTPSGPRESRDVAAPDGVVSGVNSPVAIPTEDEWLDAPIATLDEAPDAGAGKEFAPPTRNDSARDPADAGETVEADPPVIPDAAGGGNDDTTTAQHATGSPKASDPPESGHDDAASSSAATESNHADPAGNTGVSESPGESAATGDPTRTTDDAGGISNTPADERNTPSGGEQAESAATDDAGDESERSSNKDASGHDDAASSSAATESNHADPAGNTGVSESPGESEATGDPTRTTDDAGGISNTPADERNTPSGGEQAESAATDVRPFDHPSDARGRGHRDDLDPAETSSGTGLRSGDPTDAEGDETASDVPGGDGDSEMASRPPVHDGIRTEDEHPGFDGTPGGASGPTAARNPDASDTLGRGTPGQGDREALIELPDIDLQSMSAERTPNAPARTIVDRSARLRGAWVQVDTTSNEADFAPGGFDACLLGIDSANGVLQVYRAWGDPPALVAAAHYVAEFQEDGSLHLQPDPSRPHRFSETAVRIDDSVMTPPVDPIDRARRWRMLSSRELEIDGRRFARTDRETFERIVRGSPSRLAVDPSDESTTVIVSGAADRPTAVDFFGTAIKGRRICFVVDRSGSMGQDGKMADAIAELVRCIRSLPEDREFFVLFFDHDKLVVEDRWIRAHPGSIDPFIARLPGVQPGGGTDPRTALEHAFTALRPIPDELHLMTDGLMPADIPEVIEALNVGAARTVVHTYAFTNREGERILEAIAARNGGRYRHIP
jgi:hypothetical protein